MGDIDKLRTMYEVTVMDESHYMKPHDDESPMPEYPPQGTPDEAIIMSYDGDQGYVVLAHHGRFFHAQCVEAGFDGEEVGVDFAPDVGLWVFENGQPWEGRDWETGMVDDYGISGDWRKPTPRDFKRFGIECPVDLN